MLAKRVVWRVMALVALVGGLARCRGMDEAEPGTLIRSQFGAFDAATERLEDLSGFGAPQVDGRVVKLVQFVGPILPAWRQDLIDHGFRIRGYVPDHALLVTARQQDAAWLAALPNVRAVLDQPRLWRLDPRLVQRSANGLQLTDPQRVRDLTVEMVDEGAKATVEQAVVSAGGTVIPEGTPDGVSDTAGRVLHVRLDGDGAAMLAGQPDVAAIEPFSPARAFNDTSYGIVQSDSFHDGAVWRHGLHGEGETVGVCDVGVNTNSCFFPAGKIVEYQNVTPVTTHDQSHGTHTAGSIAGDQGGNGVYDLEDGMAPAAHLYVQDAGTTTTGSLSLPGDLGALFKPPYDSGVRIHSDSWGGDSNVYSARERTLDAFVAAHRDFLVLMANGNTGDGAGTVVATAKNIIAVGALDGGAPENVAAFSAHGPTADGRIKPTLTAPGVRVNSADSGSDCGTVVKSGTSMATPILAGTMSLVRQYYVDGYYPSGTAVAANAIKPSAALLKATVMAGAEDMAGDETDGSFPSNGQGFGRVQIDNALHFPGDQDTLWVKDDQEGLDQGQTFAVTLQAQSGPLHVALAWMDEPPAAGTAKVLVNNLDLEVQGPGGVLLGNHLVSGKSVPGGSADAANVEEMVYLPQAQAGSYTLVVRATDVPMGPQPFAVVATGLVSAPAGDSGAGGGAVIAASTAGSSCHGSDCPGAHGCCAAGESFVAFLGAGLAWLRHRLHL